MNKLIISLAIVFFLGISLYALFIYDKQAVVLKDFPTTSVDYSPTPSTSIDQNFLDVYWEPFVQDKFDFNRISRSSDIKTYAQYYDLETFKIPSLSESYLTGPTKGSDLYPPQCSNVKYDKSSGLTEQEYVYCRMETVKNGIESQYFLTLRGKMIAIATYNKERYLANSPWFLKDEHCIELTGTDLSGYACAQRDDKFYLESGGYYLLPTFIIYDDKKLIYITGGESYPLSVQDIEEYYNFIANIKIK